MAIDSISDVAALYSSYDFFAERSSISQNMKDELNRRLKKDVFVEVIFFQLRRIDLPDEYENAIQNTEVTK